MSRVKGFRDYSCTLTSQEAPLEKREKRMGIIIQSVFGRRQDTLHVLLVVSERIVWKMIGLYIKYEADNLPPVLSSFGRGVVDVCLVFSSSYLRTVYILFFPFFFFFIIFCLCPPNKREEIGQRSFSFFLREYIIKKDHLNFTCSTI